MALPYANGHLRCVMDLFFSRYEAAVRRPLSVSLDSCNGLEFLVWCGRDVTLLPSSYTVVQCMLLGVCWGATGMPGGAQDCSLGWNNDGKCIGGEGRSVKGRGGFGRPSCWGTCRLCGSGRAEAFRLFGGGPWEIFRECACYLWT